MSYGTCQLPLRVFVFFPWFPWPACPPVGFPAALSSANAFSNRTRHASVCGPKPTQPLQPGVAPCLATTLVVKYTRRCPDGRCQVLRPAVPKKSSHLLQLTDHESFFRWHAVQRSRFLDTIFSENDVFVCHWRHL